MIFWGLHGTTGDVIHHLALLALSYSLATPSTDSVCDGFDGRTKGRASRAMKRQVSIGPPDHRAGCQVLDTEQAADLFPGLLEA